MTTTAILIIALVMFAIGVLIAYKTGLRWLYAGAGLLWFIPIFEVENTFIRVFSVIMFIVSLLLAFYNDKESEY